MDGLWLSIFITIRVLSNFVEFDDRDLQAIENLMGAQTDEEEVAGKDHTSSKKQMPKTTRHMGR